LVAIPAGFIISIEYLNECYNNYIKLCEKSNLSHKIKLITTLVKYQITLNMYRKENPNRVYPNIAKSNIKTRLYIMHQVGENRDN
jgi:hypothetical protein